MDPILTDLPLETLHDLLAQAARELMIAAEKDDRASPEIKAKRKQVATILAAIDANVRKNPKSLKPNN